MSIEVETITTFGDVRRSILQDIARLRNREIEPARGATMGALYKELNSNIQVEINAAKMAVATENKAHNFGRVVSMGRRLIGNGPDQESA